MPSFQARSRFPCRKLWYPISSCITCFRRTGSRRRDRVDGSGWRTFFGAEVLTIEGGKRAAEENNC
jgi:hypothetical protein